MSENCQSYKKKKKQVLGFINLLTDLLFKLEQYVQSAYYISKKYGNNSEHRNKTSKET